MPNRFCQQKGRMFKKLYNPEGKELTPKPLRYVGCKEEGKKSISSSRGSTDKTSISKSFQDEIDIDNLDVSGVRKNSETKGFGKLTKEQLEIEISNINEVTILLKETTTFWLLDIDGFILQSETEVSENKPNENSSLPINGYLSSVIKKNKKDRLIQTFNMVNKKKISQTCTINKKDSLIFATEWDLYDTYRKMSYDTDSDEENIQVNGIGQIQKHGKPVEVIGIDRIPDDYRLSGPLKTKEKLVDDRNQQTICLFHLPRFKNATVISERLLASNIYTTEQTAFSGTSCSIVDHRNQPIGFHYIMKLLWKFSCTENNEKTVTAISWNTGNSNIVAVGYGKNYYEDDMAGNVCCWNVKNPDQPEKMYKVDDAVTALSFSKLEPYLLAVGCYKGAILLLNISTKTGDPVVINRKVKPTQFGTVWDVKWFTYTDFVNETEEIISVGHEGRIWKWNHREEYSCFELMQLLYSPPKVTKILNDTIDKTKPAVDITARNLVGLSLSVHPKNPMIYYVSTDEGCVVKCAINHPEQYIDIFPAHSGSVYGIQHSPFCESIFLTFGSDWAIYIWVENFNQPLLRLCCSETAIEGCRWSPTHSPILASISSCKLSLWDLSRKFIVPMSSIKSQTGAHLFSLEFSPSGKNILVGDVNGNVWVYNLIDMPFPPFLQREALIRALENCLVSRPELLKKLKSILSPTIPYIKSTTRS